MDIEKIIDELVEKFAHNGIQAIIYLDDTYWLYACKEVTDNYWDTKVSISIDDITRQIEIIKHECKPHDLIAFRYCTRLVLMEYIKMIKENKS